MAFGAFVVASALLSLAPLEQSQAQLYVDIYPSQEYTNGTLFIFSGSSTTTRSGSIRTAGSNWNQDTTKTFDNLYASNPGTGIKPLTAVPASTTSVTNKDYESLIGNLRVRNSAFTSANLNVITNAPTIAIQSSTSTNSRTIAGLYLHIQVDQWFGPRASSTALSYNQNEAISWTGSGVLTNVAISVFNTHDPYIRAKRPDSGGTFYGMLSQFTSQPSGGLRWRVHTNVIPEPEEYALVFGLFALGFVIVRRHWQKKRRQSAV